MVDPPKSRFLTNIRIESNTVDEFARQLRSIAMDAEAEGRIPLELTSSDRYYVVSSERDPSMTPERYGDELRAWAAERRAERSKDSA